MRNWKIPVLFILSSILFLVAAGQHKIFSSRNDQTKLPSLEDRLAQLPIVDFESSGGGGESQTRKARNIRHNSSPSKEGVNRPQLNESLEPILLDLPLSDQPAEPALPITSDIVAIGTVTDAKAYLSADKMNLYSEVTLNVEDVLKGNQRYAVTKGQAITAERKGGAVRFRSGKILRRGFLGKNIPVQGRRYLLFLNANPDDCLTIVTGYELINHIVVPLDGISDQSEGLPQFKSYRKYLDASETTLVDDVRKAIEKQVGSNNGGVRWKRDHPLPFPNTSCRISYSCLNRDYFAPIC